MKAHLISKHLVVPRSRSFAKVRILMFHEHSSFSKPLAAFLSIVETVISRSVERENEYHHLLQEINRAEDDDCSYDWSQVPCVTHLCTWAWLSGERVRLMTWWLRVRSLVEATFLSGIFLPFTLQKHVRKVVSGFVLVLV